MNSNTYSYSATNNVLGNNISDFTSNFVIRNDPLFYLQQRQGIPDVASHNTPRIFPKSWQHDPQSPTSDDEEITTSCSLYMAESSIPNSGLGIFAGKDFVQDEMVDPSHQVVIPLIDIESNPLYSTSLLSNYPWSAWSQDAQFESHSVNVLYPNLGMLANSHLGLANVNQNVKEGKRVGIGSEDRSRDVSTGANTLYRASTFKVSDEKKIVRGEEIFVDYGVNYFHHREEKFQMVFPTAENYQEADEIVRNFAKKLQGKDEITVEDEQEWKDMILKLEEDTDKTRVAYALPDSVEDVKYVAEIGTARYSIPDSVRSIEWLEENGFCLDNLRVGKSMIPYAGNGAFAMKSMKEGSIIAPMPILPISRSILDIHAQKSKGKNTQPNPSPDKQLLLNYCFGHTNSSLLFFPYSSSVHFVNHNEDDPNAYIRWSGSHLSKSENFDVPPKQVNTGLIMELVALRDIQLGEEITMDYGIHWSQAWDSHVNHYHELVQDQTSDNTNPAVIAQELNDNLQNRIRTIHEQQDNPYPRCIRTACHSQEHNGTYVYTVQDFENLRYCHIHHRVWKGNQYWYDAKMEPSDFHGQTEVDDECFVTDIPRYAIRFVVGEYCSDLHFPFAFRHEIGVPDDLYPDIWLDYYLQGGDENKMELPGNVLEHDEEEKEDDDDDDDDRFHDHDVSEVVPNTNTQDQNVREKEEL